MPGIGNFRAMGPRNAVLPTATASVIGFMRNPDRFPWQRYCQIVPLEDATEGVYRYPTIEPDAPVRLVEYEEYGWGWDDKMPAGEAFKPRVAWTGGTTKRYAFGYRIGMRTQKAWTRNTAINPQQLYDRMRMGHAMLHRASRIVDAVRGFNWPSYSKFTLQQLLGTPAQPGYVNQSSGDEKNVVGSANPNFQVIKKMQNAAMQRIDLQTNGALTGEEFCMVFGPQMAQDVATSGEIVNFLKQSPNAGELMKRNGKWGLPDTYNGWQLVVEDTPRVFIRERDDNTQADIATPSGVTPVGSVTAYNQRDYIWNDDSILFCSRSGGLDGGYGEPNFSTVQLMTYGGLATVKGEVDTWDEILKGAIYIEDDIQVPAPLSGLLVTNCRSPR